MGYMHGSFLILFQGNQYLNQLLETVDMEFSVDIAQVLFQCVF